MGDGRMHGTTQQSDNQYTVDTKVMGRKTRGSTVFRSSHNQLRTRKELEKYHEEQQKEYQLFLDMKRKNRRKPIMVSYRGGDSPAQPYKKKIDFPYRAMFQFELLFAD